MTVTKTTPSPAEARTQLREAEDLYSNLEKRLTSGDMGVRQSDISSAHDRVEYLEKVLKGAEVTAFLEAQTDREERGQKLHREFVADTSQLVIQTNKSLLELGKAVGKALADLDKVRDLKNAYQNKVNSIFAGDMDNSAALLFKRGHHSAGSFGAISESHLLPQPNPVETVLAIFGELLKGRDNRHKTGPDAKWMNLLKAPQLANGLRELRTLVEVIEAEKG